MLKKAILICAAASLFAFGGSITSAEEGTLTTTYDFGTEETVDGFIPVSEQDIYTEEKGYGFVSADGLKSIKTESEDELNNDCIEQTDADKSIQFVIDVSDGDYTVNVITGGDEETAANIYINGGERVRTYTTEAGVYQENEQPVVPVDGKITIEVLGENTKVSAVTVTSIPERTEKAEKPSLYIAGDSTAQTYDPDKAYPQAGWGQVAADYFTDDINIINRSIGGRSLKSYNNDGRLDRILTEIYPGDYVVIQFGHNDGSDKPERYISVEDFKTLLEEKYIGEIEKRGGIPIILTPTPHYSPDENGQFAPTILDYSAAAMEVAEKCGVIGIDAQQLIVDRWNELGAEKVKTFYFINEPGESVAYPEGTDDHTHFKEAGAKEVAKVIINGIRDTIPELAEVSRDGFRAVIFNDMINHWAFDSVVKLTAADILKGVSDTEFAPDNNVTRAEFLVMAMRAGNVNGRAYREGECLDVKPDDWFRFDVQGALEKRIIPEDMYEDALFEGNKAITREEMAAICVNVWRFNVDEAIPDTDTIFTDTDEISPWATDYVKYAFNLDLIKGNGDGTYAPQVNATRAEAAVIAARLYDLLNI